MNNTMQAESVSVEWLYSKGYTISAAARRVHRSANHVSLVLRGRRQSRSIVAALRALPVRRITLRERVAK